jgi:predicted MPP superfamily phosphohydrolase
VVREYDLYSEKISAASDGLKIILVSEFHLLSNSDIVWLEKTVALINDLNPDLVIIAGDLIDEPYNKIKHFANPFTKLKAPLGIFAVPGNHDYYHDIRSFYSFTEEAGITNLLNEYISINGDITIAGITDRTSKTNPPDVKKALNDVNPEDYLVFVSHQPLYYKEALEMGVDLILAGHTHRGQIPPLRFLIEFYFRYPYGLYEEKGSYLYTTSGVNTWGPPMRLFSHNEIIVFNLYSK